MAAVVHFPDLPLSKDATVEGLKELRVEWANVPDNFGDVAKPFAEFLRPALKEIKADERLQWLYQKTNLLSADGLLSAATVRKFFRPVSSGWLKDVMHQYKEANVSPNPNRSEADRNAFWVKLLEAVFAKSRHLRLALFVSSTMPRLPALTSLLSQEETDKDDAVDMMAIWTEPRQITGQIFTIHSSNPERAKTASTLIVSLIKCVNRLLDQLKDEEADYHACAASLEGRYITFYVLTASVEEWKELAEKKELEYEADIKWCRLDVMNRDDRQLAMQLLMQVALYNKSVLSAA